MSEDTNHFDIIYSIEDISEERAAKQSEAQALQAAQAANKAKSDLLANVSHEVRTPINLIQGMTEVLKDKPLDEETLKQIRLIEQGTETLLSQVNQLLDLTRIENQKLELAPEAFDLSQMVRDVVAMSEARAAGKGLKMHLEHASNEIYVHADKTRLRQILLNLIGNALKYTEKGSVTVSLNALMKGQSQYQVQLVIKDTGKGIEEALAQPLFQRFSKGDHDQSVPSTGLGLSISKELIDLMSGEIHVESIPGKGSTFTVDLVLDKASRMNEPLDPLAPTGLMPVEVKLNPKPLREIGSFTELSVLAVDDVETNLMVVEMLLGKMGIKSKTALSAEAAFELLQNEAVDVVLMDIQMPGMNGIEATQKIRQGEVAGVNTEIPIIALTANVMQGDIDHYLENGMNNYLSKPVSVKELTRVLEPLVTSDSSEQLK
jgi:CheY-like chemotaxis protein